MHCGPFVVAVLLLLLAPACSRSGSARQDSNDASGRTPRSDAGRAAAGAIRDAAAQDAGGLADPGRATARDAGLLTDSGNAAGHDAGHLADSGSAVARDAGAGPNDSGSPKVPPDVLAFADAVRRASEQGQAVGAGPFSCAAPLPAIEVTPGIDTASVVRAYVAAALGIPVSELHEQVEVCGSADPSRNPCGNLFDFYIRSFGGRLAETISPLSAQQLDSSASTERLTTYTTNQSGSLQVVVLTAVKAGWLTGIAVFGGRGDCAFAN